MLAASHPAARRVTVRGSRWSPFIVPVFVVVAASTLVAGTVSAIDESVLSVRDTAQSPLPAAVQVWEPTDSGAIRDGFLLGPARATLSDGSIVRLTPGSTGLGFNASRGQAPRAAGSAASAVSGVGSGLTADGSGRADLRTPSASGTLPVPGVTPGPADSDGDGLSDDDERALGSNPLLGDTDGDGLPDAWEARYGTNINAADSHKDSDGDGVDDQTEFALGLNPTKIDTTGTGIDDGAEDADGDGISNAVEVLLGSDPADPESIPDVYRPVPAPVDPPAPPAVDPPAVDPPAVDPPAPAIEMPAQAAPADTGTAHDDSTPPDAPPVPSTHSVGDDPELASDDGGQMSASSDPDTELAEPGSPAATEPAPPEPDPVLAPRADDPPAPAAEAATAEQAPAEARADAPAVATEAPGQTPGT